jgi:branched-chain amino acid transport system substrate-binding protein
MPQTALTNGGKGRAMRKLLLGLAIAAAASFGARAQAPIKIGFVSTFSGSSGVLGQEAADAFKLALKKSHGLLGGRPAQIIYGDDKGTPDAGRQLVDKMIESDGVQVITGILFSNVLLAVAKPALSSGQFIISPVAGPSQLAGKQCHPHFFSVSWQNDTITESVAIQMVKDKVTSAYFMAPNYPGGRDQLAGLKRYFKGGITEVFTAFGQLDYSAEIAELRAKNPQAVLFFYPGGMGINFLKQFAQSGLKGRIPLYSSANTIDQTTLPAIGDDAIGLRSSTLWSEELDNAASKEFTANFKSEYRRIPSAYAATTYDAGRLLDAALTSIDGKIEDKKAFRHALEQAQFESVRGKFKFNKNHFPIQNFYLTEVVKGDKGQVVAEMKGLIDEDHADAYVDECKMTSD